MAKDLRGVRRQGSRSTEVEQMLGDLDGDGRLDILRSNESGGSCVLEWHRNISRTPAASADIDFEYTPETRTLVHDGLGGTPQVRIRDKTTVEHLFHDGRGHLLVALNDQGAVKAGFTYGPFGEVLSAVRTPDDFVRRFNGKEFDEVSSLSYYRARYYDPLALSWTQADPLYRFAPEFAFDEPRRANLYAFTLNNALSFADPEGLDSEGPPACAFAGDPGGCELATGLAAYDARWAASQSGIRLCELFARIVDAQRGRGNSR